MISTLSMFSSGITSTGWINYRRSLGDQSNTNGIETHILRLFGRAWVWPRDTETSPLRQDREICALRVPQASRRLNLPPAEATEPLAPISRSRSSLEVLQTHHGHPTAGDDLADIGGPRRALWEARRLDLSRLMHSRADRHPSPLTKLRPRNGPKK